MKKEKTRNMYSVINLREIIAIKGITSKYRKEKKEQDELIYFLYELQRRINVGDLENEEWKFWHNEIDSEKKEHIFLFLFFIKLSGFTKNKVKAEIILDILFNEEK